MLGASSPYDYILIQSSKPDGHPWWRSGRKSMKDTKK